MRAKGVTRRRTQGASVSRGGGVPALARKQEWAGGRGRGEVVLALLGRSFRHIVAVPRVDFYAAASARARLWRR